MNQLVIPEKVFDQHIILLGKTRSGKSSAMRYLVEHLLEEQKPVCIVDPKGDWWGIKSSASGKSGGYAVTIFGGEHGDLPLNARSGAVVAQLAATENRPCLIDLGGWMPGERTQFWIDFASSFFRMTRGRRWLALDEVHNFCPKGKIMDPNAGKMLHWSNRLASEGLGKGVALIAASQRPQKVHNDFLTSCETLIGMRVIHKADRDAIKDWIDACGDIEKGKEVLNTIASRKRGEAWVYSPEINFGPSVVQFPMFSTYDSFRPQSDEHPPAKLKGWAEVDLEKIKERLASVVKEAEASDPAKLRGKIAELEKQLRAKAPAKPVENTRTTEREAKQALQQTASQLREMQKAFGRQTETLKNIAHLASKAAGVEQPKFESIALPKSETPARESVRRVEAPLRRSSASLDSRSIPSSNGNGDLSNSHRRILRSLVELRHIGRETPTREMVGAWSKLRPNTGSFRNYLGALRTSRLIDYPSANLVCLTDEGTANAGDFGVPSQEEVFERAKSLLNSSQRKILDTLCDSYPNAMSRDEVGESVGLQANTGSFRNYLGAMRTIGLIEYPGANMLRCADWLFI